MVKDWVSIIVRFHDPSRIPQLDEALFSLSLQTYPKVQVVLAVQNGEPSLIHELSRLLEKQPFPPLESGSPAHRVLSVPIPQGEDGRSRLLNAGLDVADGQYIGFLDYDDTVYPEAYEILVRNINKSRCPIAVGGCRVAYQNSLTHAGFAPSFFTTSKRPYLSWKRNKLNLLDDNFIPIHTFLVDRTQIEPGVIRFNPELKCFEDYEVLLKLAENHDFDFTDLEVPVAEYRIRNDGSNTIPTHPEDQTHQSDWDRARDYINQLKQSLRPRVKMSEVSVLIKEEGRLQEQNRSWLIKIAIRMVNLSNQHPRLKAFGVSLVRSFYHRTKHYVKSMFRLVCYWDY